MNKSFNIIAILLLSFSLLFGGAFIAGEFIAKSENGNVVLTWQTNLEQNVKYFEILRGSSSENLVRIATVPPKGSNSSYTYIDENAYKTSGSFYAYGLVIVDNDGSKSAVMHTRTLHENVSSVKRTWGSIKALFR